MIPDITAIPPVPPVQTVIQESVLPVEIKTQKSTRLVRLVPAKGFPIRHFNGGIVFYPGIPSAEVPVDAWIENQIKHGTLVEA
jgi:hypothetical protein